MGIGRSLLYEMIMGGQIRSVSIGRARRVPVTAIQEFVERLEAEQGANGGVA
jgi:excisionase family DNA binding protein